MENKITLSEYLELKNKDVRALERKLKAIVKKITIFLFGMLCGALFVWGYLIFQ